MSEEKRATLEVIAPSVEEAVDKGLAELGLNRESVDVEILDEGSKGLFGLGNRQARVRLAMKNTDRTNTAVPKPAEPKPEKPATPAAPVMDIADPELENVLAISQATVRELLEKMGVQRARVVSRVDDAPGLDERPNIVVDVLGDDLSILIGKQAETLNALQYITRLIVGKEVGSGVNLTVDVEGYRAMREQNLRHLAQRMANQAIKTGKRQMLEPMPANERRIIHLELRENDQVTTESTGEEPRRKVVIIPNPSAD